MKVRIDPADKAFSDYVRLRDKRCVRCLRPGGGEKGISGLQASHYFGRARESTRFDPLNVDALCMGCHQYWGSTNREAYREFKIGQLGEKGFRDLCMRAETYCKKDRKAALICAKELLKNLKE